MQPLIRILYLIKYAHRKTISHADHLQPIYALVSSWQKLEIECWPALLGGVQEQYEINAEKVCLNFHCC